VPPRLIQESTSVSAVVSKTSVVVPPGVLS
jgi:hypothetical protein